MLRQHRNLGFPFFEKNVLFKFEYVSSIFVCPSHKTHTNFKPAPSPFLSLLLFSFVPHFAFCFCNAHSSQRSQVSCAMMLCNDVVLVFVMDGCYCFLTLVISFHFGAACCTVWDCRLFLQRSQFTEESGKLCNIYCSQFG
jgi:hypothetical protein